MAGEVRARRDAARAGVVEHAQRRREAPRLVLPVEDERAGHHDERRAEALGAPRGEQRQDLHGLAEPHVVGEAAAEAEAAQEMEPAEALALVAAQAAAKAGGLVGGLDAVEPGQLRPRSLEDGVDPRLGQRGQERVEQSHLGTTEAQAIALGRTGDGERAVPLQPLLRQDPEGAIVEPDRPVAAAERGEQLGQARHPIAELDRAVEVEPVDAGDDLDLDGTGTAVELAVGLDVPAIPNELDDHARQVARRQLEPHLITLAAPE